MSYHKTVLVNQMSLQLYLINLLLILVETHFLIVRI